MGRFIKYFPLSLSMFLLVYELIFFCFYLPCPWGQQDKTKLATLQFLVNVFGFGQGFIRE